MAIVGIMAALVVPGFRDTIERNGREAAMLDLVSSLSYARSEAVTQGRSVSICVSADQATCDGTDGGNWTTGWIVFSDGGVRGTVDGGDEILQVNPDLTELIVITLNNDDDTDITNDFLSFTTDGFLDTEDNSSQVFFKLCTEDADTSASRAVWIEPTGRSAVSIDDGDGVHDDVLGYDLVCS